MRRSRCPARWGLTTRVPRSSRSRMGPSTRSRPMPDLRPQEMRATPERTRLRPQTLSSMHPRPFSRVALRRCLLGQTPAAARSPASDRNAHDDAPTAALDAPACAASPRNTTTSSGASRSFRNVSDSRSTLSCSPECFVDEVEVQRQGRAQIRTASIAPSLLAPAEHTRNLVVCARKERAPAVADAGRARARTASDHARGIDACFDTNSEPLSEPLGGHGANVGRPGSCACEIRGGRWWFAREAGSCGMHSDFPLGRWRVQSVV